jgi:hypothetical protein
MNILRKTFAAAVVAVGLAPLVLAPASAHGFFHGGGGGGFSHGFGGADRGFGGFDHHGDRHRYGWNSGYYAYPAYGLEYGPTNSCQDGYHLGEDGRCWPDER